MATVPETVAAPLEPSDADAASTVTAPSATRASFDVEAESLQPGATSSATIASGRTVALNLWKRSLFEK